jgi:type VI secretion system protein
MRPIVINVFDAETGTTSEHTFTSSPVRIGRNPLNDLPLPFAFVSGWHAIVRFDDMTARFFDLGSTNGTLLDGRRVQAGESVNIVDTLAVTIGRLELRFGRESTSMGVEPSAWPTPSAWPAQATQAAPAAVGPAAHGGPVSHTASAPHPTAPAAVSPQPQGWRSIASGTIDPERVQPRTSGAAAGTAHVPMSEIHQAVARVRADVDAWRESWAKLSGSLRQILSPMDPATRLFALTMLQREYPPLLHEPEFAEWLKHAGMPITAAPAARTGGDLELVKHLSEALRPGEEPPRSPEEATRFLQCVEDVMRASAKAFVELQKGQEQFGNEMGVRTIKEFTPLHAAGTAENVLKYLLDWQSGGPHRTQELVGVYADLMIHQVALINGVMEGARGLLSRLDPGGLERSVSAAWPTRAAALWKHFVQRYQQLVEDDRHLTEAIFGPEFSRAYAEVGGEGSRHP